MRYVIRHWQGDLTLIQTVALNFIGLRILISWCDELILARPAFNWTGSHLHDTLTIVYLLTAHGVILAWQCVGLWRYAHQFAASYNGFYWTSGAAFGSILTAAFSMATVWATMGDLLNPSEPYQPSYRLTYDETSGTVHISGHFEPGITRAFQNILKTSPNARQVALNSEGGNIYEGRGVARTILDARLNTVVDEQCLSACTLAFISGQSRTLPEGARLGFHQYRLELTRYHTAIFDIEAEQEKDRTFFRSRSVSAEFVEKIHKTGTHDIWTPTRAELVQAGIIKAIPKDGL
ncbi:hypothetical protein [Coralliovum pocilloporae]|uniref:COG3904 family protein n=1 Tax=Coralliovum pocilloporae TaxID=3066369 RepID=UPI003307B155